MARRPAGSGWRRVLRDTRTSLGLVVGLVATYLATANWSLKFFANDTVFVAQPAWTLVNLGSLDISGFNDTANLMSWSFEYNGEERSDRFPGAILWAAAFYAVQRSTVFSLFPSTLAAVVAVAIAIVVLHRVLLTLVRPRIALGGAVLLGLGTSAWTVAADALWTEGPVIMSLALAMWALSSRRWWLAGLAYAFGILTRPHVAVFAAVAGVWEGVVRRSVRPVVQVGLTSALGFVGLLIWNRINSGRFDIFPGSYGGRLEGAVTAGDGGNPGLEFPADVAATFVSPLRGLLVYSPFIVLVLPGLARAWRVAPTWVRSSAVGGVAYLVIQLAGNSWLGGGYFFGYRLVIPSLMAWWPLLTMGYQEWTDRVSWRRYAFLALAAVSVWWMAVGSRALDVDFISTYPKELIEWQYWTTPRMLGWAGPLAWLVAAGFTVVVGVLLRLVPDPSSAEGPRPSTPPEAVGAVPKRSTAPAARAGRSGAKAGRNKNSGRNAQRKRR